MPELAPSSRGFKITERSGVHGSSLRGTELEASSVAVVVAHPDDETLWVGGTMLSHPEWECFVACLCRAGDLDRAPRFFQALQRLGASGAIAELDDGPEQIPLPSATVEEAVLRLLPRRHFDFVSTHGLKGEYSRHRRHEETSRAVTTLWRAGRISTKALWLFAYDDDGGCHLPRAIPDAHRIQKLSGEVWQVKYNIITEIYGFGPKSFEARTTPREEAFWCFDSAERMQQWISSGGEPT